MHVDVAGRRDDLAAPTHEPRPLRARRTIVLSVIRRLRRQSTQISTITVLTAIRTNARVDIARSLSAATAVAVSTRRSTPRASTSFSCLRTRSYINVSDERRSPGVRTGFYARLSWAEKDEW